MVYQYVISDENGNYIEYTNHLDYAIERAAEGTREIEDSNGCGSYAVGMLQDDGNYSFDNGY